MKLVVASAVLVAALTAVAGLALARTPGQGALIDTTVRYLQESQRPEGGFAEAGQEPTQDFSAWVALALAATGINPLDQHRDCGIDAFTYLEAHFRAGLEEELAWPNVATTAFERELLVVDATGADPHDFAGYDLVGELLARQLPDGSFSYVPGGVGEANDTIFAILALGPVHEARVEEAIAAAREWVVGAENEDGGWFYSGRTGTSEVDMTGAALEALVVAGPPAGEPALAAYAEAERRGLDYLRRSQAPEGGFPALPRTERESNVASTAWAVQGIWATGGNPEDWKYGGSGPEPLDYMESMQQPDGHVRWRASDDVNGIWMTAYVVPAFAGQALPIPVAARDGEATSGEAPDCSKAGQGGESPQPPPSEPGVIAGGGGGGAPAFSRPKRGSKGRTPGGARVVHGKKHRARDHSRGNRRGANVDQARGTEKEEPRNPAEADQEAGSVSSAEATPAPGAPGEGGDGGDGGRGPGEKGAPLPVEGTPHDARTAAGEEVSGTVIGSPEGGDDGKLAFGAPGLRSAGAGSDEGVGAAIGIGAAAALAALLGAGWEHRRRRFA